jgi:hypothetical protein
LKLFVVTDVHYAGPAEKTRFEYCYRVIRNPLQRFAVRVYRHFVWLRDPFAHNHLVDRFIANAKDADYVIANGDYSCDSAFVGVSDDAACESARELLEKLRTSFGQRFYATIGDHELGKKPLGAAAGGLRIASFHRAVQQLGLQPFWRLELGNYVVFGITSSLPALPIYESETLPEELKEWRELRAQHVDQIRRAFAALRPGQRVLLFCHDPTALPYLAEIAEVRDKLPQIERTVIGHLHSNLILFKSRFLCGMPVIKFLGHTPRRLSSALRQARHWRPFNVLLCPALPGIQLFKDAGFYSIELDPEARLPAKFQRHRLSWN